MFLFIHSLLILTLFFSLVSLVSIITMQTRRMTEDDDVANVMVTIAQVYFIYSFTYTNLFHHATEKSRKTKRGRRQTMNGRRNSEDEQRGQGMGMDPNNEMCRLCPQVCFLHVLFIFQLMFSFTLQVLTILLQRNACK
jgi:hypothetical protein